MHISSVTYADKRTSWDVLIEFALAVYSKNLFLRALQHSLVK